MRRNVCEVIHKQVPVTVTRCVPTTCTKLVPTTVTTMVPTVVTKCVPTKVCKQVPFTHTVKVPTCVTENVPTCVSQAGARASAGDRVREEAGCLCPGLRPCGGATVAAANACNPCAPGLAAAVSGGCAPRRRGHARRLFRGGSSATRASRSAIRVRPSPELRRLQLTGMRSPLGCRSFVNPATRPGFVFSREPIGHFSRPLLTRTTRATTMKRFQFNQRFPRSLRG